MDLEFHRSQICSSVKNCRSELARRRKRQTMQTALIVPLVSTCSILITGMMVKGIIPKWPDFRRLITFEPVMCVSNQKGTQWLGDASNSWGCIGLWTNSALEKRYLRGWCEMLCRKMSTFSKTLERSRHDNCWWVLTTDWQHMGLLTGTPGTPEIQLKHGNFRGLPHVARWKEHYDAPIQEVKVNGMVQFSAPV